MKLCWHHEDWAEGARKTNDRPRPDNRRRARLRVETLEDRQLLSQVPVPPLYITLPVNNSPPTHVSLKALSTPGDAYAAIESKALALGSSFTGAPISGLETVLGGYRIRYANCDIYDSPSTGANEVHGAIRGHYNDLGGPNRFLGLPTTDETGTPDGVGRYNHFQGGSIYWTPSTGAHEVHGAIRDKWASLGWERSFLGYPTSDELPAFDGVGRISYFQHGWIYWSPTTGTIAVKA